MLQDYQLLVVIHINTYGHMPLEDMIIKPYTILRTIIFANRGGQSGPSSPSYVGINYYCESGTDNQVDQNECYLTEALWDDSYRMYKQ